MVQTSDIVRPGPELVRGLAAIGSATASSELNKLGIRSAHIRGPVSRTPGVSIAGPALTLQFLPKREALRLSPSLQLAVPPREGRRCSETSPG